MTGQCDAIDDQKPTPAENHTAEWFLLLPCGGTTQSISTYSIYSAKGQSVTKMSIIWQLPRDILHSVYSEWLGWKDLSRLDIACMKKNEREVWLTSLTDLRITQRWSLHRNKMKIFYRWLADRKVFCVDGFIVIVSIVEDLAAVLDMESYCPALRSIEIANWGGDLISNISQVEKNLSFFLSHCHNLLEVTTNMLDFSSNSKQVCDIVLPILTENLRENSLVKISLSGVFRSHESRVMLANFIKKHASSLRDLKLFTAKDGFDTIISTLIENQILLRVLNTSPEVSLLSYLTSAGDLLEVLEVRYRDEVPISMDDLIVSVATSCPKLTRLKISNDNSSSTEIENLLRLYEQCSHLQDVDISGAIRVDNKQGSVSSAAKGSSEAWATFLSHVLRRRQYKEVWLYLGEAYHHHPVGNLKSMLKPYEIGLEACVPESSLMLMLQDLPHLNRLRLHQGNSYTDAALAIIIEHAKSLTDLAVLSNHVDLVGLCFTDKQLSELIKACQLLQIIIISNCEMESLVAISKHSTVKVVNITVAESVSVEMLDGLLLDEKVEWPPTLEAGSIQWSNRNFGYEFNGESRHWLLSL
eukprot:scaffold96_cov167-Ochromonas_danica.AAC.28